MEQDRFDRMENMLTDLIKTVAITNKEMKEMKDDVRILKDDVSVLKTDINELKMDMKVLKEAQETTNQLLQDMRADQDHIWEKTVKNERELAIIKRHFQ